VHAASDAIRTEVRLVHASTSSENWCSLRLRASDPMRFNDPLFSSRSMQIVLLAARHAIPAIYSQREYAEGRRTDELRNQARRGLPPDGRVLKGAKPADLPVGALGLEVAPTLLARADEVIE
jgi:putative tryptophan/tyrosine transport system substrate-binding protein